MVLKLEPTRSLLRCLSVALIAAVAALWFHGASFAGDAAVVSLVPTPVSVQENETFNIEVFLEPAQASTSAWVVHVDYDSSLLQYVSCRALDTPIPGALQASNCSQSGGRVTTLGAVLKARSNLGIDTKTRIGTFRFTAIGSAGSVSPLTVSVEVMADPDGFDEPSETTDGSLSIISAIPGDADCDGALSLPDMLVVLRSTAGLTSDTDCSPNADVNHDGLVDGQDALIVLRGAAGLP